MKPKSVRKRLDVLLVERGCADSPQKASAMILAGEVQVDRPAGEKSRHAVALTRASKSPAGSEVLQ